MRYIYTTYVAAYQNGFPFMEHSADMFQDENADVDIVEKQYYRFLNLMNIELNDLRIYSVRIEEIVDGKVICLHCSGDAFCPQHEVVMSELYLNDDKSLVRNSVDYEGFDDAL